MKPKPQPASAHRSGLHWDLFCRVIDNLGDVGVCWRLAADLATRGHRVRLIVDDARALAWMAPQGQPGVSVHPWPGDGEDCSAWAADADVAVEGFGCEPPLTYVQTLAPRLTSQDPRTGRRAVWINLEYLSGEPYVERSHGLPSPQAQGATRWFFFPGFTAKTGGLIREPDLLRRQQRFDRQAWLQALGVPWHNGDRLVSLFCYDTPVLSELLQTLAGPPTVLLLAGPQAQSLLQTAPLVSTTRLHGLPWLTQTGFDELLWACDLNFVRGEDSLVRALWAGQPTVWQAYPQQDLAHHAKLLAWMAQGALAPPVQAYIAWWNGLPHSTSAPPLPDLGPWQQSTRAWRQNLWQQPSLSQQLEDFVWNLAGKTTG